MNKKKEVMKKLIKLKGKGGSELDSPMEGGQGMLSGSEAYAAMGAHRGTTVDSNFGTDSNAAQINTDPKNIQSGLSNTVTSYSPRSNPDLTPASTPNTTVSKVAPGKSGRMAAGRKGSISNSIVKKMLSKISSKNSRY